MPDSLPLIAGLGLFMLGMGQLEDALARLAGLRFRRFLRDHASTPARGVVIGALATAVLQSSTLVSLMVLAFVGAGILQLAGAIGVVMGANLGTTLTGWLVATLGFKLDLAKPALLMLGVGGVAHTLLPRGGALRDAAGLAVGVGLLLFGLDLMKGGVEAFAAGFDVSPFAHWSLLALLLLGIGVTVVVQSSTAAMMMALSALHGGMLSLEAAAAFAIGTGIGTTATAVLGALGGSADKRRVAAAHVGFNLFKAMLVFPLLQPLLALLQRLPGFDDPLLALVGFHTTINLLGVACGLPLAGLAARALQRRFIARDDRVNRYLHATGSEIPDAALEAVRKEVRRGLCMAIGLNRYALRLHPPERTPWPDPDAGEPGASRRHYGERYDRLKRLEGELAEFVVTAQAQETGEAVGAALADQRDAMRLAVISAKSVKDIRENLVELRLTLRDPVDRWLTRLTAVAADLYEALDRLDPGTSSAALVEEIARLRARMGEARDAIVADLYREAGARTLTELELSTLFNVNRELYSSAKALLRALGRHLLEPDVNRIVDQAAQD